MADSQEIEPLKVFVRFIPLYTTIEELKVFFSVCGKVTFAHCLFPKMSGKSGTNNHLFAYGFVVYETQQGADWAVQELNGKQFVNRKGFTGRLLVIHSLLMYGKKTLDKPKEQSVNIELQKTYEENEKKLKQIYYDPAVEQELQDLKMKMNQLEVQVDELKGKVDSLKGDNTILQLKLQLQELDQEQLTLKAGH